MKTIITFYTTSDALETAEIFKTNKVAGRLIPIPRFLSAGCGMAWIMESKDYNALSEEIKKLLPEAEEKTEIYTNE